MTEKKEDVARSARTLLDGWLAAATLAAERLADSVLGGIEKNNQWPGGIRLTWGNNVPEAMTLRVEVDPSGGGICYSEELPIGVPMWIIVRALEEALERRGLDRKGLARKAKAVNWFYRVEQEIYSGFRAWANPIASVLFRPDGRNVCRVNLPGLPAVDVPLPDDCDADTLLSVLQGGRIYTESKELLAKLTEAIKLAAQAR